MNFELGKEEALALAQGEGGFAFDVMNPSHIKGEDRQTAGEVNKKENGSECESAHSPENTGPSRGFKKLMRNRWILHIWTRLLSRFRIPGKGQQVIQAFLWDVKTRNAVLFSQSLISLRAELIKVAH